MIEIIAAVVGCVLTALLTLIIVYLREAKAAFTRDQKRQDERISKVECKLDDLPEKYVLRDDFIRWSISLDKKIDDLKEDMKYLIAKKKEGDSDCSRK
ncbi:MAG TPA: hypothetical protein VMW42_02895 [Desulfatiglandales bacterium]|nr:hypothetical protein [Desulfatiglandales bacterium]